MARCVSCGLLRCSAWMPSSLCVHVAAKAKDGMELIQLTEITWLFVFVCI
ncbi:hypothetical protein SAMN05660380_01552 [Xylella fastidiosa]|jgi:hypothetical protein|nr:hypothetical protein SAMN05660380_01552 [Xylella fastidiosa]